MRRRAGFRRPFFLPLLGLRRDSSPMCAWRTERVVTFGNGMTARELIVDLNDQARRLVWSVVGGQMPITTPRPRCWGTRRDAVVSSGLPTSCLMSLHRASPR